MGSQSVTSTSESQPNRGVLGLGGVPEEQLLYINVQLIRGGLVCKAPRLLYRSTLGLRIKKKKRKGTRRPPAEVPCTAIPSCSRGERQQVTSPSRVIEGERGPPADVPCTAINSCSAGLGSEVAVYRGSSSIRNRLPVGPYSRAMPRTIWWS